MKSPKTIEGMNIIKVLLKKGFEIKGRKGSHISLSKGVVHLTVVVPLTTIGIYKKICRITGISLEEFL